MTQRDTAWGKLPGGERNCSGSASLSKAYVQSCMTVESSLCPILVTFFRLSSIIQALYRTLFLLGKWPLVENTEAPPLILFPQRLIVSVGKA